MPRIVPDLPLPKSPLESTFGSLTLFHVLSGGRQWQISASVEPPSSLGSSLGSCPTFPFLNPHYNRPSGHWPWVKSVWWEAETNKWFAGQGPPGGKESIPSPSSIGPASSPPNQAAEREFGVLTTSRSRRHGIQPTTTADSAQPTRLITAFYFSHSNSSFQS